MTTHDHSSPQVEVMKQSGEPVEEEVDRSTLVGIDMPEGKSLISYFS